MCTTSAVLPRKSEQIRKCTKCTPQLQRANAPERRRVSHLIPATAEDTATKFTTLVIGISLDGFAYTHYYLFENPLVPGWLVPGTHK
jgi:hypothetical protein